MTKPHRKEKAHKTIKRHRFGFDGLIFEYVASELCLLNEFDMEENRYNINVQNA